LRRAEHCWSGSQGSAEPRYTGNHVSIAHLTEVEGFEWDEGNARKNVKHGVSQDEAEQVF
jgi:hypothetical protein